MENQIQLEVPPPHPRPDNPGFLPPSHPCSLAGIHPVGYRVMDISFSVSSSMSINLYIFYLSDLKKEYLTAVGSNLTSKRAFQRTGQSAKSYLIGFLRELKWKLIIKLHIFWNLSVRFPAPPFIFAVGIIHILLKTQTNVSPNASLCLLFKWTLVCMYGIELSTVIV